MKRHLAPAVLATAAGVIGAVVTGGPASAAPSNAPNLVSGTGTCSNGVTYSFVTNGNNGQGESWSPAFLTAPDGSHALFIPASFDITFTAPDGTTFTDQTTKRAGQGPVSCEIAGHPVSFPTASLSGTVTGTIVPTGS